MDYAWTVQDFGIARLSFPDELVLRHMLDVDARLFEFWVTGAFIEQGNPERIGRCRVRVIGWSRANARVYMHDSKEWHSQSDWMTDFPESILELQPGASNLLLRGFGRKSGLWHEVEFVGAHTSIELTEDP